MSDERIQEFNARIGMWQDERDLETYNALDAGKLVENSIEARLADIEWKLTEFQRTVTLFIEQCKEVLSNVRSERNNGTNS